LFLLVPASPASKASEIHPKTKKTGPPPAQSAPNFAPKKKWAVSPLISPTPGFRTAGRTNSSALLEYAQTARNSMRDICPGQSHQLFKRFETSR
jgi:hypothetical protein